MIHSQDLDICSVGMLRLMTLILFLSICNQGYSLCPEACETCSSEHLYCVIQGLSELPTNELPHLKKVTIQRQIFSNTQLTSANFSSYKGISHLSIRSSNINKIMPFTFSELKSLQQLDLSENGDLTVTQMAFHGLILHVLKLDNMGLITLNLDAFQGLSVRSLSIQNSNLLTLPMKLIQPLSKSLQNLYLKNNQLRTLDPQLQPIFQSLNKLEIQSNPFVCNCSILWLSKILQLTTSVKTGIDESPFRSAGEQFPQCVSPAEFRKKYLHSIASKLTACLPPNIIRIDISFQSYSSAIIDCISGGANNPPLHTFVGWLPKNESLIDNAKLERSVKVVRQSNFQRYRCRAANANGNSEIGFQIDWFNFPDHGNKSVIERKDDSSRDNRSILWRNMFSMFELLCAILGTLLITVTIFLTFFCFHKCRIHIPLSEEERKQQFKVPLQYDRTIYTDHGGFYETDIDGNFFPPPPPTPPTISRQRFML